METRPLSHAPARRLATIGNLNFSLPCLPASPVCPLWSVGLPFFTPLSRASFFSSLVSKEQLTKWLSSDPCRALCLSPSSLSQEHSGIHVGCGASGPFPLQPSAHLLPGFPRASGWPLTRHTWTHMEKPFISRNLCLLCSSPAVPIFHLLLPQKLEVSEPGCKMVTRGWRNVTHHCPP